jgi:hypothetical protein
MELDDPTFFTRARRCIEDPALVKDDEARRLGLDAVDACECVMAGAALRTDCLEKIAAAMACDEAHVSVQGAELLSLLAKDHAAAARELIWRLLHEGNEHARFAARCAATWQENLPKAFVADVLRAALEDSSCKLRINAANDVARLGLSELVPEMLKLKAHMAAANDPDWADQAGWLDLYIDLARDGYSMDVVSEAEAKNLRRGNEQARARFQGRVLRFSVRLGNRHCMTGGYASETEVRERGAATIAEEIRQRFLEDERRRLGKTS